MSDTFYAALNKKEPKWEILVLAGPDSSFDVKYLTHIHISVWKRFWLKFFFGFKFKKLNN